MSLSETLLPNKHQYVAGLNGHYLSTRLLTHNGTTIAFALGRSKSQEFFFDYSVLNATDQEATAPDAKATQDNSNPSETTEKLDSQCWFENVKTLRFSSELRVVGEEAVPVFQIPLLDRTRRSIHPQQTEKLDPWLSTSLGLMDPNVTNFEVLSDGRYIYLFRQSRAGSDPFPNEDGKPDLRSKSEMPPIDANLLCDRFNLVGSILSRSLEVRYRRSRQKRLPLNDRDTLAVQDIDDVFFYEPTFSLRFIQNLVDGRFSIFRTPTMTNDMMRWMFFVVSGRSRQIECFTTDVANDGLFDVHGQIYYTCDSKDHEVFSNAPGACTALIKGESCGLSKRAIVPKSALSDRAIFLFEESVNTNLKLKNPIALSGLQFSVGFTLEAWIDPVSFWVDKSAKADGTLVKETLTKGIEGGKNQTSVLPPTGSNFCLFSMSPEEQKPCPSVFINDRLRLVLRIPGETTVLLASEQSIVADAWNHVAVTYTARNRTFTLVVNGVAPASTSSHVLPATSSPGLLIGIASQLGKYRFQGQLDEVRLWKHPLHPATIKAKMSARATGLEPLLEACWHFDEGTGTQAFDATTNGHDIDIQEYATGPLPSKLWTKSVAPLASNIGLSKRTLRLDANITIKGGIGAGVYHEQVSVSEVESSSTNKEDTKPLKRGARVLLCFVAGRSDADSYLAILDFGLLTDGTLCDSPAIIPMPSLSLSTNPQSQARVSTPQLYLDAQGMEIFGGLLAFDAARCKPDSPCVWDSATGSITIFFRDRSERFSALTYDVSRSVKLTAISGLTDHEGLLASNKLRQAVNVDIETGPWKYAPEGTAAELTLTATMVDNTTVTEIWQGVPTDLKKFCDLLNGVDTTSTNAIGTLAKFEANGVLVTGDKQKIQIFVLTLSEPLKTPIPLASSVTVGGSHFQVLEAAEADGIRILVSEPYATTLPLEQLPGDGLVVKLLGYDHQKLVSCQGKPAGDFTQGSSILSITSSELGTGTSYKTALVNTSAKSQFTALSQSPFFSSPPKSTALQLSNNNVYTMLEETMETTASSGITFESWIRVDQMSESVLVAYTSKRLPRSERTDPEQQTFILGIRDGTSGRSGHDLVCNVNGSLFSIDNPPALKTNQWMHFACSSRSAFALKFDGSNYVDLAAAPEFNVSDFALDFTLQVDEMGGDQVLFTKSASSSSPSPLHVAVTDSGALSFSYYAENETDSNVQKRKVVSTTTLTQGVPYKIFISRSLVRVPKKGSVPRSVQLVNMLAWRTDGSLCIDVKPHTMAELELSENSGTDKPGDKPGDKLGDKPGDKPGDINLGRTGPQQAAGLAQPNESPLTFGGAPWAAENGLKGSIGPIRFYSSSIKAPLTHTALCSQGDSERSRIGAWTFRNAGGLVLKDDCGRNHGKLKNDPDWILSKFEPDHQHLVFINGRRADTTGIAETTSLKAPAGPHQLTLGNVLHGDEVTRYLAMPGTFHGQFDEVRIWNVSRTKENVTDTMNSRLSEVPVDMAVYLPFDDLDVERTTAIKDIGFLVDASINCWHLTPLHEAQPLKVVSEAPVSHDSPCVRHVLSKSTQSDEVVENGVLTCSFPAIAEYGDMQVSTTGGMEGSYKRAYSYIEKDGRWSLITGFKIGALLTEWVSQVQTSPTLKGYIEGAPPIPAENYLGKEVKPSSAIRFSNAQRCSYTYSSRGEVGADLDVTTSRGIGGKWQVSAGMGVETEVTSGEIKGAVKTAVNISGALINNAVSTATTNTNLEMRVELTGAWRQGRGNAQEIYEAANTGLALVESEVADVFALRLKVRGPVAPLVAYQVRPNPDIPKDRNLVSFPINNSYTKQGCLDGRPGLGSDENYPTSSDAPTDASYFKPVEAYALKDRIRRQEEQLAGEYERTKLYGVDKNMDWKLPRRTHRNICNSYVWTADGGTYQETSSTMDVVQTEVGGSLNTKASLGASLEMEVSVGSVLATCNVDALISAHANLTQTKEESSESSFELQTELPPAVDLRRDVNGKWVKRPGAVDAYRWMSFWLEESVEGTDAFFRQVVDPQWLTDAQEPNAKLLLQLRDTLDKQSGNARTKAWRVLHRCTYINRVPEPIAAKPKIESPPPQQWQEGKKKSALLADVSCNWHILQNLEPLMRGAQSRTEVAHLVQPSIAKLYPSIRTQPRFNQQLLDLLADYIGLP